MAIERWNPFRDLERIQALMDRFVPDEGTRGFFGPLERFDAQVFTPAIDLLEHDQDYEMQMAVPGFKPEEIQIDVNHDMLTVRGEIKPSEREEKKGDYIYRERRAASFYRQVRLPQPVNYHKAEAELKDGVLVLTMPKAEQTSPRRLEVKAAS